MNPPFIYATYPLTSAGQASSVSIFGLAGPLAAPDGHRCHIVVGSCPTFSPLPLWAVIFCCGRMRLLPSRLSPAGRPFLSGLSSPSHLLRHCCFRRLRGAADCPTSVFRGTKVRKKSPPEKFLLRQSYSPADSERRRRCAEGQRIWRRRWVWRLRDHSGWAWQ